MFKGATITDITEVTFHVYHGIKVCTDKQKSTNTPLSKSLLVTINPDNNTDTGFIMPDKSFIGSVLLKNPYSKYRSDDHKNYIDMFFETDKGTFTLTVWNIITDIYTEDVWSTLDERRL